MSADMTKLTTSSSGSYTTLKENMTEPDLNEEEDEDEEVWYALKSENHGGREYYVNPKTSQSTWILPDDDHPNPNECVKSLSSENAEKEEDTSHEGDGVEGDQATLHKTTCTTTTTTNNNKSAQRETRTIGRSVGFLLCLLAIVAILHVYSLSLKGQDEKVGDTSRIDPQVANEEGLKVRATPETNIDDKVDMEVYLKPSEEVRDIQGDENDETTVSDSISEDKPESEEASNPDVASLDNAEINAQEVPKDDNMQQSRDDYVDLRTGDAEEGESETLSDPALEEGQASTEMESESAEPVDEEDGIIEAPTVESTEETSVAPEKNELISEASKEEASELEDEPAEDKEDSVTGNATIAAGSIELDWDEIRKAVNVPRPPGVEPASSSHPTTRRVDLLTRLEQELDQAGFEIRRRGPGAVTLREKGSIHKRGMKRGGWFRLW